MRVNPTLKYKIKKHEAWQKKTDILTHKIAVYFILFLMIFFVYKMIIPHKPVHA